MASYVFSAVPSSDKYKSASLEADQSRYKGRCYKHLKNDRRWKEGVCLLAFGIAFTVITNLLFHFSDKSKAEKDFTVPIVICTTSGGLFSIMGIAATCLGCKQAIKEGEQKEVLIQQRPTVEEKNV